MNDHNLDDLIIDTIEPKDKKTKSLLTIIALLIIILIIAIILTKTLLKTPETDELTFAENMSDMIAPELKLQAQEKVIGVSEPKDEPSLLETIEEKITTLEKPKQPIKETEKEVVSMPKEEVSNEPVIIKKEPEAIKKSKVTKPSIKYYVQVGSFKTTSPSTHLLSIIRSSGFQYHISDADKNGNKKLLIGPYKTRAEIDKIRTKVREHINKDAFVVER